MTRLILLALFVLLTGCGPKQNAETSRSSTSTSNSAPDSLTIVTTIAMIADVAETISGDCASIISLMGPGVDPHLYKASASDVQSLQNAQLILYSGHHLEGQLGEVLDKLRESRPVVAVAEEAIAEADLIQASETTIDPHVWMDVSLWAKTAEVLAAELSKLKPDCVEASQARAAAYQLELAALHDWVKASIATIPEGQRILVTAHDAFAYYSRAYGIEVAGIQGISTQAEASLADIRETVDLVVRRKVPALFVESSINPRTIEAVQAAVKDEGFEIKIGKQLFSDAMGEKGQAEGTYIGMIRSNTLSIVEGLGGTAANWPSALKAWAEKWGRA